MFAEEIWGALLIELGAEVYIDEVSVFVHHLYYWRGETSLCDVMEHLFGPLLVGVEVDEGCIPLTHSEFLEVRWVSSLVTEVLPNLEYPRKSSTNSSLEIEFE